MSPSRRVSMDFFHDREALYVLLQSLRGGWLQYCVRAWGSGNRGNGCGSSGRPQRATDPYKNCRGKKKKSTANYSSEGVNRKYPCFRNRNSVQLIRNRKNRRIGKTSFVRSSTQQSISKLHAVPMRYTCIVITQRFRLYGTEGVHIYIYIRIHFFFLPRINTSEVSTLQRPRLNV